MILTNNNINLISIILIAIGLIILGGSLFYLHNAMPQTKKNPLLWALSFGLASTGGSIIISLILKHILPYDFNILIKNLKKSK
jgi:hypothetical protein